MHNKNKSNSKIVSGNNFRNCPTHFKNFFPPLFFPLIIINSNDMSSSASAIAVQAVQTVADGDSDDCFHLVDELSVHGAAAGDIAKLKAAGCFTVEALAMRTRKDLYAIKGLSEAKVCYAMASSGWSTVFAFDFISTLILFLMLILTFNRNFNLKPPTLITTY